jgi:FkbM family methyltransferase
MKGWGQLRERLSSLQRVQPKWVPGSLSREERLAMRRLRGRFDDALRALLDVTGRWQIRESVVAIEDGRAFFRAANGLEFLYVPGFGLRHLEFNGSNDRLELEFIAHNLTPGSVFIDVGASYGYYGLSVAAADSSADVHCFEPVPAAYACLTANVARNKLTNVTSVQAAVLDAEHAVQITTSTFGGDHLTTAAHGPCIGIPGTTLDAYVRRVLPERVDYIKIDVEGAELLVLRGGAAVIDRWQPIVQLETTDGFTRRFGYGPQDIFDFFGDRGYDYLVLERVAQERGFGCLRAGSGDPNTDLRVAIEFFFHPRSRRPITDYQSAYTEALRFPYI